jgi:hypothetical protein
MRKCMIDLQSASKTILGIDLLFVILLVFSLLVVEPGTESYVVAQLALVPVVTTFLIGAAVIYFEWQPFQ